jgi:hypothetical protein
MRALKRKKEFAESSLPSGKAISVRCRQDEQYLWQGSLPDHLRRKLLEHVPTKKSNKSPMKHIINCAGYSKSCGTPMYII